MPGSPKTVTRCARRSRTEPRIANAARMARSASSSCARGMPNAAMTASPANFSTVPPNDSMQRETCSKYRLTRRRTTSGSVVATSAVDSTRSTKSTVASLRSIWQVYGRRCAFRTIRAVLEPSVFKAYDVRGIYGEELDEEGAYAIGRAYVEEFDASRIAVGRDM